MKISKLFKSVLLSTLSLIMIFSFTGCGSSTTITNTETKTQIVTKTDTKTVTNEKTNTETETKTQTNTKTLVVNGPLQIIATNETYKELFDKFTADTGIKYEMLSMSSGAVLTKLKAEDKNPTFDVWFGGGINDFINAKDLGYLA